jgi:hypothetical protein
MYLKIVVFINAVIVSYLWRIEKYRKGAAKKIYDVFFGRIPNLQQIPNQKFWRSFLVTIVVSFFPLAPVAKEGGGRTTGNRRIKNFRTGGSALPPTPKKIFPLWGGRSPERPPLNTPLSPMYFLLIIVGIDLDWIMLVWNYVNYVKCWGFWSGSLSRAS